MLGLKSKPWGPSMDPASFTSRETGPLVLVVQPQKLRYCQKFAVPPRHWELDDLPTKSRLRTGQMLGQWVAVGDLPQGRVLAVSCGSSVGSDTVQWMCPCGTRYVPHTVGPSGENE